MQMVDICDVLTFEEIEEGQISLEIDGASLPLNEDNLVYKAAKLFIEETKLKMGVRIHLEKHIPIAAGMAGGSSDAAATLHGLNEMANYPLSVEQLCEIGVRIGADVPYCILGGTALAEGIGEILTPLQAPPQGILLIAKPDLDVPTAFVYKNLKLDEKFEHPDVDGMLVAIEKHDMLGVISRLANVLERVTISVYPNIREIKEFCLQHGALGALMSGSGPTVFAFFETVEMANEAKQNIEAANLAKEVFVTSFYNKEVSV